MMLPLEVTPDIDYDSTKYKGFLVFGSLYTLPELLPMFEEREPSLWTSIMVLGTKSQTQFQGLKFHWLRASTFLLIAICAPGSEVIKLFLCAIKLSMEFILPINVKIVGI